MSHNKKSTVAGYITALTSLLVLVSLGAVAETSQGAKVDYTAMSAEELAEYLIFDAEGFKLDQKTQEGETVRERLKQDAIQQACSALKGNAVDSATAAKVIRLAQEAITHPEGGIKLGDWKKGKAEEYCDRRLFSSQPSGNVVALHGMDKAITEEKTTVTDNLNLTNW